MKTRVLKRISAIVCVLLIFNSICSYASVPVLNDDTNASLTAEASGTAFTLNVPQTTMGRYYSSSSEAVFYNSPNNLKNRSNCYGYAFRMFYAPDSFPGNWYNYSSYKQRPGEFASKSVSRPISVQITPTVNHDVYDFDSLMNLYDEMFSSLSVMTNDMRMSAIVQMIQADAATLGYTLTEYTGVSIPSAASNSNKRLIAVVISDIDFHFYMQHADDTWSHKGGTGEPKNVCISHSTALTNSNIRQHACEGYYAGGAIKFFYITKDAVIDYKHRDGSTSGTTQTRLNTTDAAGSSQYAAIDIGDWPDDYMLGYFDFPSDVDYYELYPGDTETKTLTITSDDGYRLLMGVHNSSGTMIASVITDGTASLTVNIEADNVYYISVAALNFTIYENNVTYKIS